MVSRRWLHLEVLRSVSSMTIILWFVVVLNVLSALIAFAKVFTSKTVGERIAYFVGLIFHTSILYLLASAYF